MNLGAGVDVPLAGRLDADPGVRFAFSDRSGGNLSHTVGRGDVLAARERLANRVGARPSEAVFMEQVHGGHVAVVGADDRGRGLRSRTEAVPDADALVTFEAGVALHVLVADCVPVLLAEPGGALAAVHAGREGVRGAVVGAGVAVMRPRRRDAVHAVIGPAIGGCCYEVPGWMRTELARHVPEAWAETAWGQPALDLPAAVRAQLRAAGVDRVEQLGGCTRCDPRRWFSHRADADGPTSGRQGGVIYRQAEPQRLHRADDGAT